MSSLEVFASLECRSSRVLNHSSVADGGQPSHYNGMRISNVNVGFRDEKHTVFYRERSYFHLQHNNKCSAEF